MPYGILTPLTNAVGIGWVDYNDAATAITPISVTSAASPVLLTNDGLGPSTIKTYLPAGVTDVWDAVGNVFDWSELSVGDMIDIRLDYEVITTSVNTQIEVALYLGSGGGAYSIPFTPETNYKEATSHKIDTYHGVYMGNTDTLNNGGQFKITTDKTCSVIVNGWYCKIINRA